MEHNNRPFNLIDGATGETLQVLREVDEKKKISENPELPLEDRLEALEDIFDSEVGDTSLVRARNIEREVGLRQLYLKFEGGNPTGTQKDRIAFAHNSDSGYDFFPRADRRYLVKSSIVCRGASPSRAMRAVLPIRSCTS